MTPNDIDILLHYYTCPEPHPRINAPAVSTTIQDFLQRDILAPDETYKSGYRVTSKGAKLVDMLCETPDPIFMWVDPRVVDRSH